MVGERWIHAKFPSKCKECGTKVPRGEVVFYVPSEKKVYCIKCGNKVAEKMGVEIYKGEIPVPKPDAEPAPAPEVPKKTRKKTGKPIVEHTPSKTDVGELADKMMEAMVKGMLEADMGDITKKVKDALEKDLIKTYGAIPKMVIEVKKASGEVHKVSTLTHEKFADLVRMVTANMPVFIVGEAGSGKNFLCKQVAEACGLDFYFSNAITNEYKVTGFIDANGKYHETPFYKAFVNGGLFFFDEIDASIPEILVLLNAAIENRYFNFPIGQVTAHPDFRIIAAGNTYGHGATATYVGRYQLDAASLDRFAVVDIGYDDNIENHLAGGDKEILEAVRTVRNIVQENGIRYIVSYRATVQIKAMMEQGMDEEKAVQYALIKSMNIDDMNIVAAKLPGTANKYIAAVKRVLKAKGALK